MSSDKTAMKTWEEFFEILSKLNFFEKNKEFLSNYISLTDDGTETAIAHMRESYLTLVLSSKLNEREFADITYIIINLKSNFWKDSYFNIYEKTLKNATYEQLLKLRERYEFRLRN